MHKENNYNCFFIFGTYLCFMSKWKLNTEKENISNQIDLIPFQALSFVKMAEFHRNQMLKGKDSAHKTDHIPLF